MKTILTIIAISGLLASNAFSVEPVSCKWHAECFDGGGYCAKLIYVSIPGQKEMGRRHLEPGRCFCGEYGNSINDPHYESSCGPNLPRCANDSDCEDGFKCVGRTGPFQHGPSSKANYCFNFVDKHL